ncbi:hypothetical protein K466DRAFT_605143 [Polyporus arcularius HHB13444]|uniref:Uncharacterized protein n=1 Tax=Polyporus arcularius HHB13444 TaxID=1314778 RepID=A0A5C3NUH2_9APHY|nr:hypothetical protein K466DRAFT_605143 [Polyporus arcularius HHB13444]
MDVQDHWDKLSRPGQNGLLMVLLALLWWREAATPATEADWAEAAQDVAWVISHMARLVSGKRVLSKASSSLSASATTNKKARRR